MGRLDTNGILDGCIYNHLPKIQPPESCYPREAVFFKECCGIAFHISNFIKIKVVMAEAKEYLKTSSQLTSAAGYTRFTPYNLPKCGWFLIDYVILV
jgi:hypothetical protein